MYVASLTLLILIILWWYRFLLLWTIENSVLKLNIFLHKLSRPAPPHQVVYNAWMMKNNHSDQKYKTWKVKVKDMESEASGYDFLTK